MRTLTARVVPLVRALGSTIATCAIVVFVGCSRGDPTPAPITAATETATSPTNAATTSEPTATPASSTPGNAAPKPKDAPSGIPGECINMAPNAPVPEVCKHS